jgi:hypothetical protein
MANVTTRTLTQLKAIVTRGLETTIEVGLALKEIRDRKLFLEECGSFQEFCEKNWHVTRQRAYQLIDSAEVVASLPANVSTMVVTERAARALQSVPEAQRGEVVERAAESGSVTGASIKQAAQAMRSDASAVYDRTGFEIPANSPAMATWDRSPEIQEMLTNLSRTKGLIERAMESKEPMFAEVNYSNAIADLQSSYQLLKVALPYAVCPTCQGRVASDCATCRNRGMVSEFYWKYKVPDKTKEIREKAVAAIAERRKGAK